MKQFLKNHKFLLPAILLGFILALAILFVILLNVSKSSNNLTNPVENVVSLPISGPDSNFTDETNSQKPVLESEPYKFVTASEFQYSSSSNLYADCGGNYITPQAEVDISDIRFVLPSNKSNTTPAVLGNVYFKVFKNMSNYTDNDQKIMDSYSAFNKLFRGELNVENSPIDAQFTRGFYSACGGMSFLPVGYIKQIKYPGTDNAYIMIFFGSNQSVVTDRYFPLHILILSKKEDNYAIASLNAEYADVTHSNSLLSCSVSTENKNPISYVRTFSINEQECVRNAMKQDLDESKIDTIVNLFTEKFKLK